MNISGVSNTAATNEPLSLKKAIKAYKDEMLTGLTDEEKEEIERRTKEYLEKNPIETEQDLDALNNFVKSLLKKFGFKGDIEEYAVAMAGEVKYNNEKEQAASKPTLAEQYERASLGAMSVRNKFLSNQ